MKKIFLVLLVLILGLAVGCSYKFSTTEELSVDAEKQLSKFLDDNYDIDLPSDQIDLMFESGDYLWGAAFIKQR